MGRLAALFSRLAVITLAAALLASCGGLESPDLSQGAVAGRIAPAYPGGRVYLFGRPDLATLLDEDGSFYLVVPVGPAVLVAFDGADRAGLVGAVVRGAEVTWVGPLAGGGPVVTPGSNDGPLSLPLAGFVAVVAKSSAGLPLVDARFTLAGTDLREVSPAASAQALLGPLPAGSFELAVRAPGFAEVREKVDVAAGQVLVREVTLVPAAR